jgi:hypothetical protein
MKFLLCSVFFSLALICNAQNYLRVETPFNTFTKFASVEWAIRANDTIRFKTPDLREILIEKMKANKIKIAYQIGNDAPEENNIKFQSSKNAITLLEGAETVCLLYDSNGNVYEPRKIKNIEIDSL